MSEDVKRYNYASTHPLSDGKMHQYVRSSDYDAISTSLKESQARLEEVRGELERVKDVAFLNAKSAQEEIERLRGERDGAYEKAIQAVDVLRIDNRDPRLNVPGEQYFLQAIVAIRALAARSDAKPGKNQ